MEGLIAALMTASAPAAAFDTTAEESPMVAASPPPNLDVALLAKPTADLVPRRVGPGDLPGWWSAFATSYAPADPAEPARERGLRGKELNGGGPPFLLSAHRG